MAVRTALLAYDQISSSGSHVLATVGSGETWIVKDAQVIRTTGAGGTCVLYVDDGSGNVAGLIMQSNNADQGEVVFTAGRFVVLEPGMKLVAATDVTETFDVALSGSRLDGVAP